MKYLVLVILILTVFSCKKNELLEFSKVDYEITGVGQCVIIHPFEVWMGEYSDTTISFLATTGTIIGCLARTDEGLVEVRIRLNNQIVVDEQTMYPANNWTGGKTVIP